MMLKRVSKFLYGNEMMRTLVVTFVVRAIAALGAVFLAIVVGRLYGPQGMGIFAIAQSFLLGGAILTRMGMDNSLIKYVGQSPKSKAALIYLRWSFVRATKVGILLSLMLYFFREYMEGLFGAEGLGQVIAGIAIAIPAFTYGFLLAGFFKGALKPATACLLENGIVSFVAGGVIWIEYEVSVSISVSIIGHAYAIAAWAIAALGVYFVFVWKKYCRTDLVDSQLISRDEFKDVSNSFYVSSMAGFLQVTVGVMVAAWLLDEESLGLFKAAHQIAFVISFVLIVINAIFPPRYARLFYDGDLVGLGKLAKLGSLYGILISMPVVLICLLFPSWVLSWFGAGFAGASLMLQIMVVAQFINVATGSVGFLLNMTGYERLMRNIALISNFLGLLSFYVFIVYFGAVGAALAIAFVVVGQNLLAFYFVWRRLGIWTLPSFRVIKP